MCKDGISVDPDKIKAITEWPVPKNVTDIRSFMGISGYYQKFIEGFCKISYPINSLQKKGKKLELNKKCMEIFNKLKHLLTTAPILNIVDPFKDFVVCTDACKEGLSGVLLQENYVVAYEYRKLKEHEKNYVTHDLELVAIIYALKMWRHYLIGRKFLLMYDNISLKYLFDKKKIKCDRRKMAILFKRI